MMCSFCGESKEKVACSEQGDRLVAICASCITWAEEQVSPRGPNPLEVLFPDLHKDEEDEKTNPEPVDPNIWSAMFPNHPPDAICLDCGRRFDDEEHSNYRDGCHFHLNTEVNRLAQARQDVELLLDRGMTPNELRQVVEQTVSWVKGYRVEKQITFYGRPSVMACDGKCRKAWGINRRPRLYFLEPGALPRELRDGEKASDPDDYVYRRDSEIGDAPDNPGTYEGGEGKPQLRVMTDPALMNKWCARECERSRVCRVDEVMSLPDLENPRPNIPKGPR